MSSIERENTFKKALQTGVNLFLGAGFPVAAKDMNAVPLPVGGQLAQELIREFKLAGFDNLTLPQICTIIESTKKDALNSFLRKRFTVGEFDKSYFQILHLRIDSIFTTNIDDLVPKIFEASTDRYLNDITHRGPTYNDSLSVNFAPLHGTVLYEDQPLRFTMLEIASSFPSDPDKWHFLTSKIQQTPTLFWGYGLNDAGLLQALSPVATRGRDHKPKWIVIPENDASLISYFKALDFSIIISTTEELLDYLGKLELEEKATQRPEFDPIDEFSDARIPEIGATPVRSIIEFYLGSEPTWYDIYSGHIYKTSLYHEVLDSIHIPKNTLVLGIPACGKTTLLMQIAADIQSEGYKLFFRSLTLEKTQLLLRKLQGRKGLIFVDNFTDNVDAFSLLLNEPNVVAIGADRDYNFDVASHRINHSLCKIIDVSELSDKDVQEIYSRLPLDKRSKKYVEPDTEEGASPSLFEVIEANIFQPNLKARYNQVLSEILDVDTELHDLFVMFCYVHSCRTPVSFDMAYSFLRKTTTHYAEVYEMIERLGALVYDYFGSLIDSKQDHFIPRSTIVSETILQAVTAPALKRVLLRFHEEISPFRICNYDIFKRRAFDANLGKKAFPHWEEGKEFFEMIYNRDQNPYILQQGALYLSHKHRFKEAFTWIDQAVLETNRKIPSIRNSHAIILFRANIQLMSEDDTVKRTLKQSMDILSECYNYDKRKTYHAMVFADQALQYWNVYGDSTARDYLVTAAQWLSAEKKQFPWNRNVRRLYRLLSNKIQEISNSNS